MEGMTARITAVAAIAGALAASAWYALRSPLGADYASDAGPAIDALAHGDIGAFFDATPLLGSFSLLLRAPLAALADGSELAVYRLGALPCLLALGALAVALERLMARRGQPVAARMLVAGVCLVNPVTADALVWGHPEELLAAALCVGAGVAALQRRWLAAGVLLGLALGTKQWAVLAVLPVLLAAESDRLRTLGVAVAVAALLSLPTAGGLLTSTDFALGGQAGSGSRVTALNVWWPFAEPRELVVTDGVTHVVVEKRSVPDWLVTASHVLIVALALPLAALFHRRRPQLRAEDALALLALLLLLRCMLDPWNNQYYHVPFLVSLAAWEGLRRRGLPVVTVLAATAMWLSLDRLAPAAEGALTNAMYLAWSLPLAAGLAAWLYAPATVSALGKRLRISRPVSVTTTRSSIRTPKAPVT
jgi:alpha-1,6-mannosyltransferase